MSDAGSVVPDSAETVSNYYQPHETIRGRSSDETPSSSSEEAAAVAVAVAAATSSTSTAQGGAEAVGVAGQTLGIFVAGLVVIVAFLWQLYSSLVAGRWGWFLLLLCSGSVSTLLFVALGIGFYAAGIAMRPMWYKPTTPQQGLTRDELPEYWQGVTHDPLTDLGIPFEDVCFPSILKLPPSLGRSVSSSSSSSPSQPNIAASLFAESQTPNLFAKLRLRKQTNKSSGPLLLRGWFVQPADGAPKRKVVIVAVHGGGRDRRAFLRHTAFFYSEGYPVLLFDFREHGCSDGTGRGFTYGVSEHLDVIAATEFAKTKTGLKFACVLATSVGATSAIIAAAKDRNIDAVIAENPLTRPEALFSLHVTNAMQYAFGRRAKNVVLKWLGRVMVAVFLYRIGAVQKNALWPNHRGAIDVVHEISPRPILIMHGQEDKIIPVEQGIQVYNAAREPKSLWLCKGAVHCALYDRYPTEYRNRVLAFLTQLETKVVKVGRSRSYGSLAGL